MVMVRWDPFRNLTTLQGRINRLFEDAFPQKEEEADNTLCAWRPMVDIYENQDGIVIQADLPGVDKEKVSVEVKENILTIRGDRDAEPLVGDEKYYRRERSYGTFQRSFTLRHMISPDRIKASFKNGVLRVEIPKQEEEKPKQVTVTID